MFDWALAAVLAVSPPPAAVPPEQVLALPAELRERVRTEVLPGAPSSTQRLERLSDLIFDPQRGLGLVYREEATYSVGEVYATRAANCLTFTLLFVALAREAGLDVQPQEIAETLAWRQHNGTVYRNSHINVSVRIGLRRYTVDVARDIVALHRPSPISDRHLLSHYYNNLAMAELGINRTAVAQQHMQRALELGPSYSTHWSNAGVILLRAGDPQAAGQAYRRALELDPENSAALLNMIGLARRNDDARAEAEFRQRLDRVQQKDPLHHFLQGMDFERAGDPARAIRHYRRAIALHRTEHRFHAALARAYLRLGDTKRASRELARAAEFSEGDARAAYQAELRTVREGAKQEN